jgi:Dolichyl-phosphate-mannose-protein mannosyltransferase
MHASSSDPVATPVSRAGPVSDRASPAAEGLHSSSGTVSDRGGTLTQGLPWLLPAILALFWTACNAAKPLHIDDATYYRFARQAYEHPSDPYGFSILYFNRPLPANHVLAPPVVPYWWAVGMRLLGDEPWRWKLWFLPFAALFVFSLWDLLQAFAPRHARILLVGIVLSPPIFPAFNLMTDIPAQALALSALALFRRAALRNSTALAVLSGMLAALAAQTKYTGFLSLAAIAAYALTAALAPRRSWSVSLLALVSIVTALVLFSCWEIYIASRYGQSHFLFHLRNQASATGSKLHLVIPLMILLGYLAPSLVAMAIAVCLKRGRESLFRSFSAATAGVEKNASEKKDECPLFLIAWLALEVAGYFLLSPFAAARRIIGIVIVGTILVGRFTSSSGWDAVCLRIAMLLTALLGLAYAALDWREADAQRQAAIAAVNRIRTDAPGRTIWYCGYWGFQFYAERAGARQVVPAYQPFASNVPLLAPSRLHAGDWIIAPTTPIPQQRIAIEKDVRLIGPVVIDDKIPLRTAGAYYVSSTPLEARIGPRVSIAIGEIQRDLVPEPEN